MTAHTLVEVNPTPTVNCCDSIPLSSVLTSEQNCNDWRPVTGGYKYRIPATLRSRSSMMLFWDQQNKRKTLLWAQHSLLTQP